MYVLVNRRTSIVESVAANDRFFYQPIEDGSTYTPILPETPFGEIKGDILDLYAVTFQGYNKAALNRKIAFKKGDLVEPEPFAHFYHTPKEEGDQS